MPGTPRLARPQSPQPLRGSALPALSEPLPARGGSAGCKGAQPVFVLRADELIERHCGGLCSCTCAEGIWALWDFRVKVSLLGPERMQELRRPEAPRALSQQSLLQVIEGGFRGCLHYSGVGPVNSWEWAYWVALAGKTGTEGQLCAWIGCRKVLEKTGSLVPAWQAGFCCLGPRELFREDVWSWAM